MNPLRPACKFRYFFPFAGFSHYYDCHNAINLQGTGAGNKPVTALGSTTVLGRTRNMLVAVSFYMLAAAFGHAGTSGSMWLCLGLLEYWQ